MSMASASSLNHWPALQQEDRIRRNVACVNCRNSKVRCRQSPVTGEPCQRCAKLDISCVVDKTHKRVTKRSKLEKLERELDAIRQAVRPAPSNESPRPPRSPRLTGHRSYPEPSKQPASGHRPSLLETPTSLPEQQQQQLPGHTKGILSMPPATRPAKELPSEPRSIGLHVVSGEDIDWYFDKYLECFHPFIPVVTKKDPDECYRANPTLFWVIIFVASRRYSRDPLLFNTVVDHLSREIWLLLSSPVTSLETIHAIVLICAWPLPTVRFATDPSTVFSGIIASFCMGFGLHTGRGSHPEFCIGVRAGLVFSDEEASCMWAVACILYQRSTSSIGYPPPHIQYNDAPIKKALSSPEWMDLMAMYDVQKFLNQCQRVCNTHIMSNGFVPESVVAEWEENLEGLSATLVQHHDTELTRAILLQAKLDTQCFYFAHAPNSPGPNFTLNADRAVRTARSLIATARSLESSPSKFLTHAPQWAFRSLADAAYLLVSSLHSASPAIRDRSTTPTPSSDSEDDPAERLVQQCIAALSTCSVREFDLAVRCTAIIQGFWSCRHQIPLSDVPAKSYPNRLAAGVTYWCLHRFHRELCELRGTSEQAREALKAAQPQRAAGTQDTDRQGDEARPQTTNNDTVSDTNLMDWSLFMDDFGWSNSEGIFMGLS